MDYTQANKKREMANKMTTKYNMGGEPDRAGSTTMGPMGSGGQKYKQHGVNSGRGRGMEYPQAAKRETAARGQKFPQQHEPTKMLGHRIYSQNGPDRHTA